MLEIRELMLPISGGVIGYCTNWLAIKMVLRPHTKKYFFKIPIPFTPGLIVRERDRLTSQLSKTIESEIITKSSLKDFIKKLELQYSLDKALERVKEDTTGRSVNDFLGDLYKENKEIKIENFKIKAIEICNSYVKSNDFTNIVKEGSNIAFNFLEEDLGKIYISDTVNCVLNSLVDKIANLEENKEFNMLLESLSTNLFEKLSNNNKDLNFYIRENFKDIEEIINGNIDDWAKLVIVYLRAEDSKEFHIKLKDIIKRVINSNFGALAGSFINIDLIYPTMLLKVEKYLEDKNNYEEMSKYIENGIKKACETKVSTVTKMVDKEVFNKIYVTNIKKILKNLEQDEKKIELINQIKIIFDFEKLFKKDRKKMENTLSRLVIINIRGNTSFIVEQSIRAFLNLRLASILEILPSKVSDIKNVEGMIFNVSTKVINKLDIGTIVKDKFNNVSMKEFEKMIMSVVKKELNTITNLGAVLGFILGLLALFI